MPVINGYVYHPKDFESPDPDNDGFNTGPDDEKKKVKRAKKDGSKTDL